MRATRRLRPPPAHSLPHWNAETQGNVLRKAAFPHGSSGPLPLPSSSVEPGSLCRESSLRQTAGLTSRWTLRQALVSQQSRPSSRQRVQLGGQANTQMSQLEKSALRPGLSAKVLPAHLSRERAAGADEEGADGGRGQRGWQLGSRLTVASKGRVWRVGRAFAHTRGSPVPNALATCSQNGRQLTKEAPVPLSLQRHQRPTSPLGGNRSTGVSRVQQPSEGD